MFQNVLIPFDVSERTERALEALRAVAAPGGSVELLHVVEQVTEQPDPEFESFYRSLENKARAKGAPWCAYLERHGFIARLHVCVGRRGAEILRRVQELKCDLVLIPSHAVTSAEVRLGTLSHQIAMLAPCSVLLVR